MKRFFDIYNLGDSISGIIAIKISSQMDYMCPLKITKLIRVKTLMVFYCNLTSHLATYNHERCILVAKQRSSPDPEPYHDQRALQYIWDSKQHLT